MFQFHLRIGILLLTFLFFSFPLKAEESQKCGDTRLRHSLERLELRLRSSKRHVKMLEEDIQDVKKLNSNARIVAFTSSASAGIAAVASSYAAGLYVAGAVAGNATMLAEFIAFVNQGFSVQQAATFLGIAGTTGVSAGTIVSDTLDKSQQHKNVLSEFKKRVSLEQQRAMLSSIIEQETADFIESFSAKHRKLAEDLEKHLGDNNRRWWTFGWDDANYVGGILASHLAKLELYEAELKYLPELLSHLSDLCERKVQTTRENSPAHVKRRFISTSHNQ